MVGLQTVLVAMALGCVSVVEAASSVTVSISGIVQAAPPCVINNTKPITVPFSDVQIAEIDGSYKAILINYTLDCARAVSNELRMQVSGNGTWFLPKLLAVPGNTELGIALKKDDAEFALNTWADFDASHPPKLKAVLVKRALGSEIIAGTFSASATLVVEYR